MDRVGEDHRIGPTHISLFLAILYFYRKQEYVMPIYVYRKELMKQAKISAIGTYHKGDAGPKAIWLYRLCAVV
jgi:hypothetical protein